MNAIANGPAFDAAAPALTVGQEFALYQKDRPAWLAIVAPRMAKLLRERERAFIAEMWGSLARDYQRAVWLVADEVTREAIRLARLPAVRLVPDCPMPEHESDLFGLNGGMPA